MRAQSVLLAFIVAIAAACDRASTTTPPLTAPKPAQGESNKLPSLDEAVSTLKSNMKDAADAAHAQMTRTIGPEIERIAKQLEDIADDFGKNSDQLHGDAKTKYDNMRMEFDKKKEIFNQRLKEFNESTAGARQELVKGLYQALSGMKDALDRAAEAFRQANAPEPEQQPV